MTSSFGNNFKILTFGESHGPAVGVVIDGIRPGINISRKDIQRELDRRKPGQSKITSPRKEEDKIHILSGIFNGKTTGHPICMLVYNKDHDPKAYDQIKDIFRPGHADLVFYKKYGIRDHRGGGRSSGRETISRVAAGALAKKIIQKKRIKIIAHTIQVGKVRSKKFDQRQIEKNPVRCADKDTAKLMEKLILSTKKEGDSIGGIIEVIVKNCPPGLGDPVFEKLDANLAKAIVSIGSVKGVEFGKGFGASLLKGSVNNDELIIKKEKIASRTNNSGGILGGISTGEDIIFRVAIKPTPSISKEQKTVTIHGKNKKISIKGRHDPCICPRVIPVIESMCSIVIADALMEQSKIK
jgi:chorismate synthase